MSYSSTQGPLKERLTAESVLKKLAIVFLIFGVGYFVGIWKKEHTLAMAWTSNTRTGSTMAAIVSAEPSGSGFDIEARVLMSPEGLFGWISRWHDCGVIGHVSTIEEASKKFGKVEWSGAGLRVGPFSLDRQTIERDR